MQEPNRQSKVPAHIVPARGLAEMPTAYENAEMEGEPAAPFQTVLRYLPLGAGLLAIGALVGCLFYLMETPVYKARVLLEVNAINENLVRSSMDPLAGSYDPNDVNVQTQIKLLQVGPVSKAVIEDLEAHPRRTRDRQDKAHRGAVFWGRNVQPLAGRDIALKMLASSFTAQAVTGTRLIELSCESTEPVIAAEFLNRVAAHFVAEGDRARSEGSLRATQWLRQQFEETKLKLQGAEEKMREFTRQSGGDFASGSTLSDAELKQLQADLATAQADLIARRARYENAAGSEARAVPEIMDDPALAEIRKKLADLRDQRKTLEVTLTPEHYKMKRLDADEKELLSVEQARTQTILARLRTEYDGASRKVDLLTAAYRNTGGRVLAESEKMAQYSVLKRDVDNFKTIYDALLQRLSQAGVSSSIPVGLIRLVEPSLAPEKPYKPKAVTDVALGVIGGLFCTFLIAFAREKADRSIRVPGAARELLRVPELGVIPELSKLDSPARTRADLASGNRERARGGRTRLLLASNSGEAADELISESFRMTLTSLLREIDDRDAKVILITSPEPGDGKTTIASNLALAMAESGKNVVLVDADFRKPRLRDLFDIGDGPDLGELLSGDSDLDGLPLSELVVDTVHPLLSVAPTRPVADAAKIVHSRQAGSLFERLRQEFDLVVVDVPPVLAVADARILSRYTDGAALVIRAGRTDQRLAIDACRHLLDDRVPLLGTVLNYWTPDKSWQQRYYNYYASN